MKTMYNLTTKLNNAPAHMNDYGFDFVCLNKEPLGERNWKRKDVHSI